MAAPGQYSPTLALNAVKVNFQFYIKKATSLPKGKVALVHWRRGSKKVSGQTKPAIVYGDLEAVWGETFSVQCKLFRSSPHSDKYESKCLTLTLKEVSKGILKRTRTVGTLAINLSDFTDSDGDEEFAFQVLPKKAWKSKEPPRIIMSIRADYLKVGNNPLVQCENEEEAQQMGNPVSIAGRYYAFKLDEVMSQSERTLDTDESDSEGTDDEEDIEDDWPATPRAGGSNGFQGKDIPTPDGPAVGGGGVSGGGIGKSGLSVPLTTSGSKQKSPRGAKMATDVPHIDLNGATGGAGAERVPSFDPKRVRAVTTATTSNRSNTPVSQPKKTGSFTASASVASKSLGTLECASPLKLSVPPVLAGNDGGASPRERRLAALEHDNRAQLEIIKKQQEMLASLKEKLAEKRDAIQKKLKEKLKDEKEKNDKLKNQKKNLEKDFNIIRKNVQAAAATMNEKSMVAALHQTVKQMEEVHSEHKKQIADQEHEIALLRLAKEKLKNDKAVLQAPRMLQDSSIQHEREDVLTQERDRLREENGKLNEEAAVVASAIKRNQIVFGGALVLGVVFVMYFLRLIGLA
eukprot:TRINITY_DN3980_c0_g1_i1.p1 TRINITY_DN3980_c0_g1~~TRINITY_DN3980_c0_g1_i1.p1  ORF type:complete len:575 (+),score=137.93 TRINITY_DN3980_c0_g1_i1:187-1911(+)